MKTDAWPFPQEIDEARMNRDADEAEPDRRERNRNASPYRPIGARSASLIGSAWRSMPSHAIRSGRTSRGLRVPSLRSSRSRPDARGCTLAVATIAERAFCSVAPSRSDQET